MGTVHTVTTSSPAKVYLGIVAGSRPQVPQRGDVDDVRIRRINHDPSDVQRFLEAHVRPVPAAIHGLVDAVTSRIARAVVGLAGAHPHSVGVGRGARDVADRAHSVCAVEDRVPPCATVRRLPDTADGAAKVRGVGHSGGDFASTDAILSYPDFYKVAVSESGNHDNRSYQYIWGEKYQGMLVRDTLRGTDSYENQLNYLKASNLI